LKHEAELQASKKQEYDQQYFENYFSDPKRILPSLTNTTVFRNDRGRGDGMRPRGWQPNYDNRFGHFRGRGRGFRGGFRGRPFDRSFQMEPPPGFSVDPRSLREYVDLDAPSNDEVHIDYRKAEY